MALPKKKFEQHIRTRTNNQSWVLLKGFSSSLNICSSRISYSRCFFSYIFRFQRIRQTPGEPLKSLHSTPYDEQTFIAAHSRHYSYSYRRANNENDNVMYITGEVLVFHSYEVIRLSEPIWISKASANTNFHFKEDVEERN